MELRSLNKFEYTRISTRNKLHRSPEGVVTSLKMRRSWRKYDRGRAESSIFVLLIGLLLLILNVSSPSEIFTTMAITTRSGNTKEKSVRRTTVNTAASSIDRHPHLQAKRLARSPPSSNVNKHLAEINRPSTRINTNLLILGPSLNSPTDREPENEPELDDSFDLETTLD